VLFEDKPVKEAVKDLMIRARRVEHVSLTWNKES
jgi:hypothetical protein